MKHDKQIKYESWLLERIAGSSAGYLAALEDSLREFSQITGSLAYQKYIDQQEAEFNLGYERNRERNATLPSLIGRKQS